MDVEARVGFVPIKGLTLRDRRLQRQARQGHREQHHAAAAHGRTVSTRWWRMCNDVVARRRASISRPRTGTTSPPPATDKADGFSVWGSFNFIGQVGRVRARRLGQDQQGPEPQSQGRVLQRGRRVTSAQEHRRRLRLQAREGRWRRRRSTPATATSAASTRASTTKSASGRKWRSDQSTRSEAMRFPENQTAGGDRGDHGVRRARRRRRTSPAPAPRSRIRSTRSGRTPTRSRPASVSTTSPSARVAASSRSRPRP